MKFERGKDPRDAMGIGSALEITWGQRLHRNSLYKLQSCEIYRYLRQLQDGNKNTVRMNLTFYDSNGIWHSPKCLVGNRIRFNYPGRGEYTFIIDKNKF